MGESARRRGSFCCKDFRTGVGNPDIKGGVALRQAAFREVGALVALDRTCFGARAWGWQAWREAVLDPAWTTLVLARKDEIIAAMVLILWPPVASLASIAVHPDHRRRGHGGRLLAEAVARASRAGARWLSLEVDAGLGDAIGMYRHAGFGLARRFIEDGRWRQEMLRRLARKSTPGVGGARPLRRERH